MRITVRTKLLLGFLLVTVLIGIVGLFGINATKRIEEAFTSKDQHFNSIVMASVEVSSYAKRAEGHLMQFLLLGDKADREKFFLRHTSLLQYIETLDKTIQLPEARTILEKIKLQTDELLLNAKSLLAAYDNDMKDAGIFEPQKHRELILKFTNTSATIRSLGVELSNFEISVDTEVKKAATQNALTIQRNIFLVLFAALILALGLAHFISILISKPIAQLKNAIFKITEGDLNIRASIQSNDEVGELANVFNHMTEEIRKGTEKLKTEITERKQAGETLKLQAELLDTELDAVDLHDFEGNYLYVNRSSYIMLGYTKEELLSMKASQLNDKESAEQIPMRLKELTEKGKATFTVNRRRRNGSWIPLEVRASLIELGGKKLIMSVARDISERLKMQEQLMAQDRLVTVGQLVAGVAHEINNPLTGVIGFSELLLQADLPENVKSDLRVINDEGKRAAKIVQGLLSFSRQRNEGRAPFNIQESIEKVLQLRRHEEIVSNIQIKTNFAPGLPQFDGSATQLQQVFLNLVVNAEQAMLEAHDKGTLKVTTEKLGDIVKISFEDDGPGISQENMKKLFTPFFTTKETGKGTGLAQLRQL